MSESPLSIQSTETADVTPDGFVRHPLTTPVATSEGLTRLNADLATYPQVIRVVPFSVGGNACLLRIFRPSPGATVMAEVNEAGLGSEEHEWHPVSRLDGWFLPYIVEGLINAYAVLAEGLTVQAEAPR